MKFYVTTSIAYVNADPHIGFATELVHGDVLKRWHALIGDDTFYLTGTDENSHKLLKAAARENTTPQALADKYAARFKELTQVLGIANDDFIRTTDKVKHFPGAQEIWRRLVEAGYIYKGQYEGDYCIDCEQFYQPTEAPDGTCPIHGAKLEHRAEENYLFKLSAFTDPLKEIIGSHRYRVIPENRRNEILALLEKGLQDVSFSRPAATLQMGVPVPDDDSQVMYVWCDALTNYLTGVGFGWDEGKVQTWWPADIHLVGKDIIRFHAAIWPAMLLGAGLPLPKQLYVHGFFTVEGEKMSKSKGNVINPLDLVARHGADPVRYYLLHVMPYSGDCDYSDRHFAEVYAAHLTNNVGNLFSRVAAMIGKGYNGKLPSGATDPHLRQHVGQAYDRIEELLDDCAFAQALAAVHEVVVRANRYIDERQPYKQKGQDQADTLYTLGQVLGHLSVLYTPFIPHTAEVMRDRLGVPHVSWDRDTIREWEKIPAGRPVNKGGALFPKREI